MINMITKRILFYTCLSIAFVSIVSVLTSLTTLLLFGSIFGMWWITKGMSIDEINTMLGANWFNKVFNTNDFTKE